MILREKIEGGGGKGERAKWAPSWLLELPRNSFATFSCIHFEKKLANPSTRNNETLIVPYFLLAHKSE